jgi:hypothetical protein
VSDAVDLARATFGDVLDRLLGAQDDAPAMLEALVDGGDALVERDDLDEDEREQAIGHYHGLVDVLLEAEDLAVRALSAVVHDEGVAGEDRIAAAAAWINDHARDEDVYTAAIGHLLYLNEAEEQMPVIVCAWERVRCAWLGIEAKDDPHIQEREALLLCDPRMAAAAELGIAEEAALRTLDAGVAVAEEHRHTPEAAIRHMRTVIARDEEVTERQRAIAADLVEAIAADPDPVVMRRRRERVIADWFERILADDTAVAVGS